MTILTGVSDVLALLAAGVALLAAARALQAARRPPQPTTAAIPPVPAQPASAEPATHTTRPAARSRTTAAAGTRVTSTPASANSGGSRSRGDALREQIRAHLAEQAGQSLSLVEIARGVDRRSATVSYALDKLMAAGQVELTNPKPRRYAIITAGASVAPDHPTAHPDPEPTPTTRAAERQADPTADTHATAEPPPSTPATTAPAGTADSAGTGDLREEIRAYLAEHPGEHLSLIDVAHGVGRASATVSYQLQRLVDAGEVTLASDKPRRYTHTTAAPTSPPEPPAATSEPAATAERASAAVPPARRGPRAAKPASAGRKPAGGRGGRKTGAATGQVAAAGK